MRTRTGRSAPTRVVRGEVDDLVEVSAADVLAPAADEGAGDDA